VRAGVAGALAAALAVTVAAAATAAKPVPSNIWVVKSQGFAITLPKTWQAIPPTVADVKTLIARYKKSKSTADLANYYGQIIGTKAGLADMKTYKFQAFDWPISMESPVPVDVRVGVVKVSKPLSATDLPAAAAVFERSFLSNKNARGTKPDVVTLRSGKAGHFKVVFPIGGGFSQGIEMYLIPHGKRVYELLFGVEGQSLAGAKIFTQIAQLFRFI
jgi:hypothetical protein